MSRSRCFSSAHWAFAFLCASLAWAQSSANIRAPLGVYVKVDVQDAISGYNGPARNCTPTCKVSTRVS